MDATSKNNPNILIVCFDNIGDLVFCSSLMEPLTAKYPDSSIDLWCKDYTKEIGAKFEGIKEVISADPPWDQAPGRKRGTWISFFKSIFRLRSKHYDQVIVASPNWRASFFVWFLKSTIRIGFDDRRSRRFLTSAVQPIDRSGRICDELSKLLAPLGISSQTHFASLDFKPKRLENKRAYVYLHPFAGNPRRCVPLDLWFELYESLRSKGYGVYITGSKADLARLKAFNEKWLNAEYETSSDFGFKMCDVFVGHDSGPTHIVSGYGIPIFATYFDEVIPKENLPQGSQKFEIYRTKIGHFDGWLEKVLKFVNEHSSV